MKNIQEIRNRIVEEASGAYLEHIDGRTIINACPRSGKTFCSVEIFKQLNCRIVIAFPRVDIKAGWEDTFKYLEWKGDVEYITFTSLKHLKIGKDDLLVLDECHELSVNQLEIIRNKAKGRILGLTGTLTKSRATLLYDTLGLDVCYTYNMSSAVEDGILSDYEINIHLVELDNTKFIYGKGMVTERKHFNNLMYRMRQSSGIQQVIIERAVQQLIQDSYSKLQKTRELLAKYKNERVIVFCGLTDIANQLEIPVYHSKKKDKEVLEGFCSGNIYNRLATVNMLQAGITIKPINRAILNHVSGAPAACAQKICRTLAFEWEKSKAYIDMIVINEEYAIGRAETALLFFDENKINWK